MYAEDSFGNCAKHHRAVCETCAIDEATASLRAELAEANERLSIVCGTALHYISAHKAAEAQIVALREALIDMLSGWKYIRETHGDLYGVGWGRAQKKAEAALAAAAGQENAATATQLWSADPHTM